MLVPEEYKWMSPFYQSITALVLGLSGLRSLDRYIDTRNGNGNGSGNGKHRKRH